MWQQTQFSMTLLAILFKEKWNRWVILGMIIAMSGSLLALTKGNFSANDGFLWLWANIINWGANLLGRLHLIGEKYWRALIHHRDHIIFHFWFLLLFMSALCVESAE